MSRLVIISLSWFFIYLLKCIVLKLNPKGEKKKKQALFKQVGPKKAREMWFLSRFYSAVEAEKMGLVNTVVPVSSFPSEKS